MITDDGWTVEVIDLNGWAQYRLKRDGYLIKHVKTLADVQRAMGDSFARLRPG